MPNPELNPPDPSKTVCTYMLRAKRLTLDPGNVELVWFDDKELKNSTYALYVASYASGAPRSAVAKLCASQQLPPPQGPYSMAYVGSAMGSYK